jgi:phosphoribosylamine--glycine ligase
MKILLIGSGGREHALAWQLKKNPDVRLISAPGSSALATLGQVRQVPVDDIAGLTSLAREIQPDLTVIGPEGPLVLGLADAIRALGFKVFGPSAAAARIEGSKVFAKDFMIRHNLPTASYAVFYDPSEVKQYLEQVSYPVVIKADGLAQGKGVVVCGQMPMALKAVATLTAMEAGGRLIVEEYLAGEELSCFAITDGQNILTLPSAQDHKTIFDNDRGPNTGGMGAYSPAPLVSASLEKQILENIFRPSVDGLAIEGTPFCGLLYAGLMITMSGPKLLEFNARFGDPETQALMPRLRGNLAETLLSAAEGRLKTDSLEWDPRSSVCVVMSSEGYPGPYRQGDIISGLEKAGARPDIQIFEAGVSREKVSLGGGGSEPCEERPITKGGRVLGVTALGHTLAEAVEKAYQAVGDISWAGAHYRKDIASKALHQSLLYSQGREGETS